MTKIKFNIINNATFGYGKEYMVVDENNRPITQQTYRTLDDARQDVKLMGKVRKIHYIEMR